MLFNFSKELKKMCLITKLTWFLAYIKIISSYSGFIQSKAEKLRELDKRILCIMLDDTFEADLEKRNFSTQWMWRKCCEIIFRNAAKCGSFLFFSPEKKWLMTDILLEQIWLPHEWICPHISTCIYYDTYCL